MKAPVPRDPRLLANLLLYSANDVMNHAIQLMSEHPGVKAGPFEIRPAADLTEMMRESERRRGAAGEKSG